jgi:pimeloyl-ACP methyl ester carboxylesterase
VNDSLAQAAMIRGFLGEVVTDQQVAAVRVPTLAIVGSADLALAGVKSLKAAWSALSVVVIEGASHRGERGAASRPEFVQAIRGFISTRQMPLPRPAAQQGAAPDGR